MATVGCHRGLSSEVLSRAQEEALFEAASHGDANEVTRLLDQGINADVREAEGETPLMYAAAEGQNQIANILIDRGASINALSENGETALMRAVKITVRFKTPQTFSALDIDVTPYDRVPDKELHGLVYLSDYSQGVRMETSGDSVSGITYYPAASDDKLRCPPKR